MIDFHYEIPKFGLQEDQTQLWIVEIISSYGKEAGDITFIFSDDEYLLDKNVKFLKHNTLTDIISFDYSEGIRIEGDIFISVERVRENAEIFQTTFDEELHRVIIHGVLHFIGFKDKTKEEADAMRNAENKALEVRNKDD